MILVNVTPNTVNADFHFVPTVHVADTARAALKAYVATAGATARIAQSTILFNVPAPQTAAFSSRGPLTAGGGDLLKPDIIGPGQDIIAAVAPTPPNGGFSFNMYSGTSMSSPRQRKASPDRPRGPKVWWRFGSPAVPIRRSWRGTSPA